MVSIIKFVCISLCDWSETTLICKQLPYIYDWTTWHAVLPGSESNAS